MIQPLAVSKRFEVVFDASGLVIDADRMENDGENLTFWDELGVLIAKIPLSAIWTYDVQEVGVAV